ncbi:hypothetical protein BG015_006491, partial [Linnemannia schmuckeri]
MESPHATLSESPFGVVKPSSFFTKPIRVAPLNIATKHQHQQHQQPSLTTSVKMMSPTSFASRPPLSIQTPRPLLSSQTFLEANVRLLCDMVDSILRTNESDQKMLRIEVSQQPHSGLPNTLEPSCNDPKSPLYILSPKSFTQAKSDISKLDDSVVSKLNSDTLLDLFPTPPPLPAAASQSPSSEPTNNNTISITSAIPHLTIPILDRPTTIVVSPTTSWSCPSEDSWECRPRKGSKQHRNWVISSGLFVSTSETAAASEAGTEEGEKGENNYTHLKGALIYGSEKMTETEASGGGCYLAAPPPPGILSPAPPMTTTTALSSPAAAAAALPRPLVARRSLRQEKNHSSFSSTVGSSLPAPLMTANLGVTSHSMDRLPISSSFNSNNNNLDTPCSVSTTMSPFSSMDALSQSLLNIETQMRRPSFLMNRRTSILSTLFATNSFVLDQYDRSEQPSPFLSTDSLTVESAEIESSPLFLGVPKERHESDGAGPLDTPHCESESVQAMDWRAWHGSWIRRRIKPEDDSSVLSPTSPAPRTSYSSIRSSSVLSPTSPAPRSSYSSTRSSSSTSTTTCSSPNMTLRPATTLVKRLSQRLRRPRMLSPTSPTSTLSSSASSPLAAFASSPMSTFYSPFALPNTPTTPTKDANPELWENEGQKWGDRFQSLINNFQPNSTSSSSLPSLPPTSSSSSSPNGKSSKKRWADILPK